MTDAAHRVLPSSPTLVPCYPWLLALYPIVSIAALNGGEVAGSSVLLALAGGAAATTICAGLFRVSLRSWHEAALCTTVLVIFFYGFGPLGAAVDTWLFGRAERGAPPLVWIAPAALPLLLSGLWLLALWCALRLVRRIGSSRAAAATRPMNLIACLLLGTASIQALPPRSSVELDADAAVAAKAPASELPDIYYVILDGYARADVLEEYYGHDNTPFLNALRDRGFVVDEKSNANYYWTFLSLASSLNMDYLPAVLEPMPSPASSDVRAAYELIRHSRVAETLRERGYKFMQLESTWSATRSNRYADKLVSCSDSLFTDDFIRALAEASWLRVLTPQASASLAACHNSNFQTLPRIAAEPGPKFVLAHFLVPHHPYLFDREGNVLHEATLGNQFDLQARLWNRRGDYLDQLLYVNDAVLAAVAGIEERSVRPAVIVLQSDHGPQLTRGLTHDEQRRVRLANLAAFRLPGAPAELMPQGDSPVNYFRRILDFYLGTELRELDNRHYYSAFRTPFELHDVTEIVHPEARPVVSSAAD